MSKQIQVSDELHARLKSEAAVNYRSIANHIEYLLSVELAGVPDKTPPTPKKIEEKIISEAAPREMFRTTKDVLMEINTLEKEMSESVNQDPEWWNDMAGKKQALWDEYHTLKEE